MPGPRLDASDLLALLERVNPQPSNGKLPPESAEAQQQFLRERIVSLTHALSAETGSSPTTRIAERLLLADVALVTAQLCAHSTELAALLAAVLDHLGAALHQAD